MTQGKRRLKRLLPFLASRPTISIFKGTFAFLLTVTLAFIQAYDDTVAFPVVLTSAVLVSIAGKPGGSIGSCVDACVFGGLGVGVGAVFFIALAKLGDSQVAQGFVWLVLVYILAIIKAQSMRFFAFSLLAIIVSFSGMYTSILLGTGFSPPYLESYLTAYAYGLLIVLGVNVLIFPISAEREMREILVNSLSVLPFHLCDAYSFSETFFISLDRVASFSHLIAKTYSLELSEEERKIRDVLAIDIKNDIGFVASKIQETSFEVNYSRFSMESYQVTTQRLRQMQQGLMASYTSLTAIEANDPATLAIVKKQLAETNAGHCAFNLLRRSLDLSIRDIISELNIAKASHPAPIFAGVSWNDFAEKNMNGDLESSDSRQTTYVDPSELEDCLARVCSRLKEEVVEQPDQDGPSKGDASAPTPGKMAPVDRIIFLQASWEKFKSKASDGVSRLIQDGFYESEELHYLRSGPSLHQQWMPADSAKSTALPAPVTQPEQRSTESKAASDNNETDTRPAAENIMRVYSFIFGMGTVISEVSALHMHLVPRDGVRRPKRFHFHVFERLAPKSDTTNDARSLREALSDISGVPYVKPKVSLWSLYGKLEALARSDTSLYSLKVSLAVTVYSVFLLAPSLKSFFVNFALTSGLITIVVAVSPTIGQGVFTFGLQILATGFGALYAMVALYIARGAQPGYVFSPYLLITGLLPLAIFGNYLIYTKPQYFVGGLLAMNSAGSLIITEWVYNEVPGQIRPGFDNPGYRAAKTLAATCLALVIASCFQILILRKPARRDLRLGISKVTFSLASYQILFSSLLEKTFPIVQTGAPPPSHEAVVKVFASLRDRERHMQEAIIALSPLLKFSAVEPSFGNKFDAKLFHKIIRTHQLILDRFVGARTAISDKGFSDEVKQTFVAQLGPYRLLNKKFTRAGFYLCGTSLLTKTPLPGLPSIGIVTEGLQHDALILANRVSKTSSGQDLLHSDSFIRYFYYLICLTSIGGLLSSLEEDLHLLFGDVESDPYLVA